MQFLQWLFKSTDEKGREDSSSPTKHKERVSDQEAKPKHIIVFERHDGVYRRFKAGEEKKFGAKKYLKLFLLCRKDIATACFYSTLDLKSPSSGINTRQHWVSSMKMKKEDIARGLCISKVDQASHAGKRVLPISETTLSTSTTSTNDTNTGRSSEKKEKVNNKGDKSKTMSRMKELFRWAAAAKSEKGGKFMGRKVLLFRNKEALKAVPDDDQLSLESPKISLRWDVESCSTASSAYSAISVASSLKNDPTLSMMQLSLSSTSNIQDPNHSFPKKGNWITTDSEFVVLEL